MTDVIRVMIVEDMEPIRKRYIRILCADPAIEVVCDTDSGEKAVPLAQQYKPDIILMDIELETKEAGLIATRRILEQQPDVCILMLTVYDRDDLLFTAFQYGARDYLLKSAPPESVVETVKRAWAGMPTLDPVIERKLRNEFRRIREYEGSLLYTLQVVMTLTGTELSLLTDLHNGLSRKDICASRYIEMSTLRTHMHNILKKFGASSIDEIVASMDRLGLFKIVSEAITQMGGKDK